MTRKKMALVPAAAAGLALLLSLLYMAVISFAFDPGSYHQEPPYDAMAQEVVAYLSGETDALPDAHFTQREQLHMVDVLRLFKGGKQLAEGCLLAAAILAALALVLGGRQRLGTGLLVGMAVFLVLVVIVGIWALVDFDGWFVTMHELVFDNDLWLLDPAESMLINMMPLDFFMCAVRDIAVRFALGAALLLLLALALRRPGRDKGESLWITFAKARRK